MSMRDSLFRDLVDREDNSNFELFGTWEISTLGVETVIFVYLQRS